MSKKMGSQIRYIPTPNWGYPKIWVSIFLHIHQCQY